MGTLIEKNKELINEGNKKFSLETWMKDKFTGDVLIVFNQRELVNKILKSQMGLEYFIKTLGAKFFFTVGMSSAYPSLKDFLQCDEPEGIIWRSFEQRSQYFMVHRMLWIGMPPLLAMVVEFIICYFIAKSGASAPVKGVVINLLVLSFNLLFDKMMEYIAVNYASYKTKEKLQNQVAKFLIPIKLISSIANCYRDGYSMLLLCVFNALIVPLESVLNPEILYKANQVSSKPDVSQKKANELTMGPNPQYAFWISDFMNNIGSAIYVSYFYPISIPIGTVGCFLHYWNQKYIILQVCQRQLFSLRQLPFEILGKWNYMMVLWGFLNIWVFGFEMLTSLFIWILVAWIPLSTLVNNYLHAKMKFKNKYKEYHFYKE
jgi:hypothetical protein